MLTDSASSSFKNRVSFDSFGDGEQTEKNTESFTLNVKHQGYQYKRRSRSFMVGIAENDYSETALRWALDELIDDGDELICVRVVDPESKMSGAKSIERKQYQEEAKLIMRRIQKSNIANRAISIVLELAVGKLHTTFQSMVDRSSQDHSISLIMPDTNLRACNAHCRYEGPKHGGFPGAHG
jgi:hypothetical protein